MRRRLLELIGRSRMMPRRSRLDDELREEIEQHIELRRDQLVDAGVDPREALAMARRQFGNVTRVREDTRAMWSFPAVDTVVQDLRYGLRMMRRSPAVSLVAVLSLGLGIGGAAAVFGLADVLLIRQLPVRAPEQLAVFRWSSGPVSVFESLNGNAQRDERDFSVSSTSFSPPAFEAMRGELSDRAEVFGFADLQPADAARTNRPVAAAGASVRATGDAPRRRGAAARDERPLWTARVLGQPPDPGARVADGARRGPWHGAVDGAEAVADPGRRRRSDRDPGGDRRQPLRLVAAVRDQPIVSACIDCGSGDHARGVAARGLHPGTPGVEGRAGCGAPQ